MAYKSKYQNQINEALGSVTNFEYDPMKDASYQALAKVYTQRGDKAAKSTMADAASLNGGYGTSYAVSAAQQARNDYNAELAARIPDLEANAYNRNAQKLSALIDADAVSYGRYRDTIADQQWQKEFDLAKKGSSSGGGSGSGGGGYYGASGSYYGRTGHDNAWWIAEAHKQIASGAGKTADAVKKSTSKKK